MAGNGTVKVKIDKVEKIYSGRNGDMVALNGVSLDIMENEFVCVVGPSGCGKSTLLNIIAGLLEPTSGAVYVDGKEVHGPGPERGVVFQQYALFPWLTVLKNVQFGLKLKGMGEAESREIAMKYLKMVDLEQFADSYPKELSGGMKQRVAIARAYAVDPSVLLMDEPFGHLDAQTRYLMQEEVERIWSQDKRTVVFITNNIEEALYLADRIILLSSCPTTVRNEFKINLPRPRDYISPEFLKLREEISKHVETTE